MERTPTSGKSSTELSLLSSLVYTGEFQHEGEGIKAFLSFSHKAHIQHPQMLLTKSFKNQLFLEPLGLVTAH